MSPSDPSRDEALRRLDERADALEARTARPAAAHQGGHAANQAYRILGDLFGGVIVGLALGFGADRLFGSAPWGLITGVLLGFAVSVWMARRTANRLMAQAKAEEAARGGPPPPVPFDDEED